MWSAFSDELTKIANKGAPRPRMPSAPKIKAAPPQVRGYQGPYATGPSSPVPSAVPPLPASSTTMPTPVGTVAPVQTHGTGAMASPARMPNMPNPLTQGAQPPMAASGQMMQPSMRY